MPVIVLIRRDLVACYVSGQAAEWRGIYHGAAGEVAPFEIDLGAIRAQVAQIHATHAVLRKMFAGQENFVELAYEDLFVPDGDDGHTRFAPGLSARMAALMGVEDRFDRTPRLQKVSGGKGYGDLITNWSAVEALRAEVIAPA